jgi:glycosyltransferase involved in cell wall biosynthesis
MIELAILIPVLRRPQNIAPLVESVRKHTKEPFELIFIASPGDEKEINELSNQKQSYITLDHNFENKGDYARKLNTAFKSIEANWYFLGADDLKFHPGWFEAAMFTRDHTDACVIGTNDMGSPVVMSGQHATHSLVLRDYVLECGTIDERGKILHEGYQHNFVDSEFVETAKWRGAWAFAMNSKVEHLHPDWKKGKKDPVYAIGKSGWETDRQYFEKRKRLWP